MRDQYPNWYDYDQSQLFADGALGIANGNNWLNLEERTFHAYSAGLLQGLINAGCPTNSTMYERQADLVRTLVRQNGLRATSPDPWTTTSR